MLLPWVPDVFLECGGNFWCWPKADISPAAGRGRGHKRWSSAAHYKDLRETANRARKVSGQDKMLCLRTIFTRTYLHKTKFINMAAITPGHVKILYYSYATDESAYTYRCICGLVPHDISLQGWRLSKTRQHKQQMKSKPETKYENTVVKRHPAEAHLQKNKPWIIVELRRKNKTNTKFWICYSIYNV